MITLFLQSNVLVPETPCLLLHWLTEAGHSVNSVAMNPLPCSETRENKPQASEATIIAQNTALADNNKTLRGSSDHEHKRPAQLLSTSGHFINKTCWCVRDLGGREIKQTMLTTGVISSDWATTVITGIVWTGRSVCLSVCLPLRLYSREERRKQNISSTDQACLE